MAGLSPSTPGVPTSRPGEGRLARTPRAPASKSRGPTRSAWPRDYRAIVRQRPLLRRPPQLADDGDGNAVEPARAVLHLVMDRMSPILGSTQTPHSATWVLVAGSTRRRLVGGEGLRRRRCDHPLRGAMRCLGAAENGRHPI